MLSQPFMIPSLLLLGVSIPLVLKWVPQNSLYGVRTSKTLADAQVWYDANRFGGIGLACSSLVYLIVAGIFPTTAHSSNFTLWLGHLGAFVIPILFSLVLTLRFVKSS